eukprot:scaffold13138_cov39-Cylindrotheca_fusiformis.AAC.1
MSIGGFIGIRKNSRARPENSTKTTSFSPLQLGSQPINRNWYSLWSVGFVLKFQKEPLMRITPPSSSGVGGTHWPAILMHCLQIKRKRARPLGSKTNMRPGSLHQ